MDRIRFSDPVAQKLKEYHLPQHKKTELLSFAYGSVIELDDGSLVVLVCNPDEVFLLAADCYSRVGFAHLGVHVDVRAGIVWNGVTKGQKVVVVIDIHDHFFADEPHFSGTDDRDDLRTAFQYRMHLGQFLQPDQTLLPVSLLIARHGWAARRVIFDGAGKPHFKPFAVDILGEQFERHGVVDQTGQSWTARQSAMILPRQRASIQSMRVVIVGAGGTGSIVLETACRLEFRLINIIDGDHIESSNLNRLHGACAADVGKQKAQFLAARGRTLFPEGRFSATATDAFSDAATAVLVGADLILGCIDNAETRFYLNRLAVQFAIPYFDCGTLVQLEPQPVFHSRVNAVIPGLTRCGHCSDVEFLPRKVPDAFLDLGTLAAQRGAGYVQDHAAEQPAPAVYPLNQQVVSAMMNEVLNWICGWKPFAHSLYQRSDRLTIERLDRSNYARGPADDCPLCSSLLGTAFENKLPRRGGEVSLSNLIPDLENENG